MTLLPGEITVDAGQAYYNEVDPFAAAWLRELIKAGLIAPGVVDERPIQEVRPSDVEPHTQAHFFAGIGVWSYALRAAGWPDERPVWTGSCPCQPFSASGKRKAFADERHLWPVWFQLIRECRPDVVFGEQVSSPDGLAWLDAVSVDVEAAGYAIGALGTSAAGVGAPHGRQRLYFVAESGIERREGQRLHVRQRGPLEAMPEAAGGGEAGALADTAEPRPARRQVGSEDCGTTISRSRGIESERSGPSRVVGDPGSAGGRRDAGAVSRAEGQGQGQGAQPRRVAHELVASGVTRGFWSDAEWIPCRDGKYRPVEPGSFPLAPRAPGRVGRLRGYGNALNAEQAQAFIAAYMDVLSARQEQSA